MVVFFGASLSYSFGVCATTSVTKVAKKGARVEPSDLCQKHGIYHTRNTSDPPGGIPKPDVSSKPSPEASWMAPEAHLCDPWAVWGARWEAFCLHGAVYFQSLFSMPFRNGR